MGRTARIKGLVVSLALVAMTACTPIYQNHGYVPSDEDLSQIAVGVDTRATVDEVVGVPTAGGVLKGNDYYYVRSRVKSVGPFEPKIVERQVLAISFDNNDVVQNIERFGLSDGRVVPLSRRVTSSSVENKGFLRQLLGNLGSFNPGQMLGN